MQPIPKQETRPVFRVLAAIIAIFFLLVGLPAAILEASGIIEVSGAKTWEAWVAAFFYFVGGVGMGVGAWTGQWPFALRSHRTQDLTQVKWIENCLLSFDAIKPGLTRNHIKNIFPMDGGLQFVSPVRFVHPECAYLKIDVDFEFKRDVTDQGRAIVGKDDKVTNVSKPYIERPHMD
jgi:hypothetical protein